MSLGSCDSLVQGSHLGVVFLMRCVDPRYLLQILKSSGPVVGFLLLPLLLGEASGPPHPSHHPPPQGQDTEKRDPCSGFRWGRWVVGEWAWMVLSGWHDLQTQRWGAQPQSQGQASLGHSGYASFSIAGSDTWGEMIPVAHLKLPPRPNLIGKSLCRCD